MLLEIKVAEFGIMKLNDSFALTDFSISCTNFVEESGAQLLIIIAN